MLFALLMAAVWQVTAEAPAFWPKYTRPVKLLDSPDWAFALDLSPHFDSLAPLDPSKIVTPNSTAVPSCFDAAPPGFLGPRGVAMYRKSFTVAAGKPAKLQFGACSFYCRVFVDGHEIGEHRAGGYSMFHLDVPAASTSTRELFVLADNRFNKTTAPTHTGGDFWHYGGLMRSVVVHELESSGPVIWRAEVHPTDPANGKVDIRVVLSDANFSGSVELKVAFDGGSSQPSTVTAVGGVAVLSGLVVPFPKLWDVRSPSFHTVSVEDAHTKQGVIERFGLRKFAVSSSGRLMVNGKVVKLHGWNHHTQWPDTAASPTEEQMDSDIQLLLEAGTNYVRGAHYPQDPRWLDRLDEAGILMWEEALGPGVSVYDVQSSYFMKYQLQQVNEMLDAAMNHPAILTWGFFNEGPSSDSRACSGYQACADAIHVRDTTRFITWASNHRTKDVCLSHATWISFNNYPGWYSHMGDKTAPKREWTSDAAWVREHFPSVPFQISETGAGGIYEWAHNTTDKKWTQKYQTEIIEADVKVALENTNISAITLWHFFDFKGNDDATKKCGHCDYEPDVSPPTCAYIDVSCSRPGGENHKGVVGFWRRKKEAYAVVAALYNASHT